jgi:polysaccharide biosynthesis protein PslG
MVRMRTAIRGSLAVLAGAAATAISSGCNAADRRPLFGFNESAGPGSYRLQAKVGAPIRRMLVGWNQVQPAPGIWRWGPTDAEYRALLRVGLRPLFVAVAAPCWAHPSSPCAGSATEGTPPDPPYDGAWTQFIRRLARRYPKAAGIEIWNEENVQPQFLPYPNPARYTQLLKDAYRAVRCPTGCP